MTPRKTKTEVLKSTAQQLGSIVKSSRKLMRKDKGLNGDLDRLPMLTWIMFLKFLDDMEHVREEETKLAGKKFRQAIDPPYRWRDWANKPDGMTGPELIAFINQEEAVRPDGKKGAGLFAYLKSLQSANGDRRDVIAKVFEGTVNRMINGYLLRDVVNKVNEIHFASRDEIHTLGQLYESMLREMRDAAGDSGEFYTPRALVKFIVTAVDPRLGETVLDPAAGTGGFLVEAFEHLKKQARKAEDFTRLQKGTLHGVEPKPLPYLLCQMNLLLHGVEYPEIDPLNALRFTLREIGDKDRVDVIMTNPPFGGEEEKGTPCGRRTIVCRLNSFRSSSLIRAAIPSPNSTPFGTIIPHRPPLEPPTRRRSLRMMSCRKSSAVSAVCLSSGKLERMFAPYTSIPTNLLFFDRTGPTKHIWYYEQPLPEGRKNYTKTAPIQFEEFTGCIAWWKKREENERAWKVRAADVLKYDGDGNLLSVNLDVKNPAAKEDITHLAPEQLVSSLLKKEQRITEIISSIEGLLTKQSV